MIKRIDGGFFVGRESDFKEKKPIEHAETKETLTEGKVSEKKPTVKK